MHVFDLLVLKQIYEWKKSYHTVYHINAHFQKASSKVPLRALGVVSLTGPDKVYFVFVLILVKANTSSLKDILGNKLKSKYKCFKIRSKKRLLAVKAHHTPGKMGFK